MKRLASSAAVAFAIANLYLLFLTGPLVSPGHQLIFHLPGSGAALFASAILDLIAFSVGLTALLFWARSHPVAELWLYAVLLLPLPWVLVETVAGFSGTPASLWATEASGLLGLIGFAYLAPRARALLPRLRHTLSLLRVVLSFVALSGVLILGQLVWLGWEARGLNPPFASAVPAQAASRPTRSENGSPRVVWIILDELSFRQVYSHRFAGLALPNFDRLAAEATLFPDALAAAQYTRVAVPSLLTGLPISATVPTADGHHLLFRRRGQPGWKVLQPKNTVFGDAVAAGLPTGVAGWYEPYCRILPAVLDRCFWTYSDDIPGGLSPNISSLRNALQLPATLILRLLNRVGLASHVPSRGSRDVEQHANDYRALLAAGDDLLRDQSSGLQLLHMPIPHPWGFYDRHTHDFPNHRTSYIDNLALADAYLGHVRSLLEQQGSWDTTDVIIMGDHGWRTRAVWRHSGFWTLEEDAASQGAAATDAPAMIVKLHGQHTPAMAPAHFDAVRTRALIDALLDGRLNTCQDLVRWAAQPRSGD